MPDDNGNGVNSGEASNNVVMQSVDNIETVPDDSVNINPVSGPNNSSNVENIVVDESENDNRNNIQVDPAEPQNVDLDLDVNIELVNQEVLGPQLDLDADAEEFRRRFYEAISRRNAQLAVDDSPPAYDEDDEFEEGGNINLIEEIMEDEDDEDDSFDGITTGQPSSREDRDFDSDENALMEREEVSSVPVFDLQLPSRHAYLGEAMETLAGRQILEGGTMTDIPLVLLDFHLVPGQTLPLTVFHAGTQSALRRCVPNNRHFGIVHSGLNDVNIRSPLPRRALGTTAEIYEFQEEREPEPGSHITPSINIKAKGRHRFNVLSTYRQSDGHLYAKVRIRPEISLQKQPWRNLMSNGHRYMFPAYPLSEEATPITTTTAPTRNRRSSSSGERKDRLRKRSGNSSSSSQNILNKSNSENFDEMTESSPPQNGSQNDPNSRGAAEPASSSELESREKMTGFENYRKINKYYAAMTSWPYFVYEQFDESILVERLHQKLTTELSSLTTDTVVIPRDATDLSFWLAQNLTMNDSLRLQILKMDTPIERLRFASKLIDKVSRVIECKECQAKIANHNDIFSMSIEGPQGTYVNPHGYVHELITVSRIKGGICRGLPSTESSWFPGYSWTLLECRLCHEHIGWKFLAEERLKPAKFWGLARRSVSFKYDFSLDSDCPDLDAPRPQGQPPSSSTDTLHADQNNQDRERRDSEGQDSTTSSNFSLALI